MKLTLSFGVKINFILGLGLAILVGVGVLSWRSIQELVDTGRDESSTLSALAQIEVVSGQTSRTKTVWIDLPPVELEPRLAEVDGVTG